MSRFQTTRERLSSMGRGTWLAIGLIVIAAIIGALFVYGEPDELANEENGTSVAEENEVQENGTDASEEDGQAAVETDEDRSTEDETSDDEERPAELADTGAAPLFGALLLGAGGYLFHRSRGQVAQAQRK